MRVTDQMLYKYVPLAVEELLKDYAESVELPFQPSEAFEKKMNKLIRQSHHPQLHFRFMTATGRVAAIVVICIALLAATTFTLKAADALRIRLKEQICHEGYIEEHYLVTGEAVVRKFTYIPEEYTQIYMEENSFGYVQQLVDEVGNTIDIMVTILYDETVVIQDNDFKEHTKGTINQIECYIGRKENGAVNYVWMMDGVRYDVLSTNLNTEQIEKMIISLK